MKCISRGLCSLALVVSLITSSFMGVSKAETVVTATELPVVEQTSLSIDTVAQKTSFKADYSVNDYWFSFELKQTSSVKLTWMLDMAEYNFNMDAVVYIGTNPDYMTKIKSCWGDRTVYTDKSILEAGKYYIKIACDFSEVTPEYKVNNPYGEISVESTPVKRSGTGLQDTKTSAAVLNPAETAQGVISNRGEDYSLPGAVTAQYFRIDTKNDDVNVKVSVVLDSTFGADVEPTVEVDILNNLGVSQIGYKRGVYSMSQEFTETLKNKGTYYIVVYSGKASCVVNVTAEYNDVAVSRTDDSTGNADGVVVGTGSTSTGTQASTSSVGGSTVKKAIYAKISGIKKGSKKIKITTKIKNAKMTVKVGKKSYKVAVKGKKGTAKLKKKLKKGNKVTVTIKKSGYKNFKYTKKVK